jgi:AraC-like DNA-binding protein
MDRIKVPSLASAHLETLGISTLTLLQQAHLPLTLLHQERTVLNTRQWFAIWRALEEITSDPALGLKIGSEIPIERFDPIYIAAVCARSFHEALSNVARYKQQFCAENMRIVEHGDTWHIDVVWTSTLEQVPALLIDGMFASHMTLGQRGSGQPLYPERVLFARKAKHRALYESYFHCLVEFNADSNMMIYNRQAMKTPFRTFNPDMLALLIPQLEEQLRDDLSQQPLSSQVKALVQTRLPNKQTTMQDIARELNTSTRTLQRQLASEGTRFQQIFYAARHELAQQYLRTSALDLNEIAYLLGYKDAHSFHRAFHHWEGTPPGQWRNARHSNKVEEVSPLQ